MSFTPDGEWIDDGKEFVLVRGWCPDCIPEGIPEPWTPERCSLHFVKSEGDADIAVRSDTFLSGNAEAGGVDNAAFCALFRKNPA